MLKTPNNQDSFRPNHKSNQAQPERTGLWTLAWLPATLGNLKSNLLGICLVPFSQVDACMAANRRLDLTVPEMQC
eukprot:scaffold230355_cov14-Tisochrysis_lutea.AAC.1